MDFFRYNGLNGRGFSGYSFEQLGQWLWSLKKKSYEEVHDSMMFPEILSCKRGAKSMDFPNPIYLVAYKKKKNGRAAFMVALMDDRVFHNFGVGKDLKWYNLK